MSYETYWIKRAERRIADRQKYLDASIMEIDNAYTAAMKELDKDINRIILQFTKDKNLTRDEVEQLLKETIPVKELDAIRKQIETIEDASIRKALQDRISATYYRNKISRKEALREAIQMQISKIADRELAISTEAYIQVLKEEYLHNVFDCQQYLGFAYSFTELPEKVIEQILQDDWSKKHYSRRIWGNAQTIAEQVETTVLKGAMLGTNSRKMAKELDKIANTGMFACERLIRTETTYFTTMADLEAAKQRGTEKLRFVATLDSRTSEQCQKADGTIIPIADAVPGRNIPPLHPFCRSVIIDVIEGLEHKVRRARNPVTGKNYLVPADMTYEKWKKLPISEKSINFGNVKGVKFAKKVDKTALSGEQLEQIKTAISKLSEEYDIKLDYFEVGNYTGKYKDTPMFYRAKDEEGFYKCSLIINNASDFWTNSKKHTKILNSGFFAGDTVEQFVQHELAHVLTYQGCTTIEEYYTRERATRLLKRFGISRYADTDADGAETIAEAFVKRRKGKAVSKEVEDILNKYIEVWKR